MSFDYKYVGSMSAVTTFIKCQIVDFSLYLSHEVGREGTLDCKLYWYLKFGKHLINWFLNFGYFNLILICWFKLTVSKLFN